MSPEQAAGKQPDHRADIYALGIILYELLTGRVPFEGESFMSVLSKHATKHVPALRDINPSVRISRAREEVVFRALRKDPDERFTSMREMALALESVGELPPLVARDSLASAPPLSLPIPAPAAVFEPPSLPQPELAPDTLPPAPSQPTIPPRRGVASYVAAGALAAVVLGSLLWRGVGPPARAERRVLPPIAVEGSAQGSASTKHAPTLAGDGKLVTVRVTTEPAGAVLRSAAGSEVCAVTPCAVEVARGESIELVARFGALQASTKVAPSATEDLHLVLTAPAPRTAAAARPEQRTAPRRDELKVPAAFRELDR
jgi:serine/threonine-protein kinase